MSNLILREKAELIENVRENAEPIEKLINPSDLIHQNINDWSEVNVDLLKEELYEGVSEWHYMATHPYENQIQELAALMYMERIPRIPLEHLIFESEEKAIIEGYWPYNVNFEDCREIIYENRDEIEHYYEVVSDAQSEVEVAVVDGQVRYLE